MKRARTANTKRLSASFVLAALFLVTVFGAKTVLSQRDDSGRKARVLIDVNNKRNITGFAHICQARAASITPPRLVGPAIINLRDAMRKWTKIETTIENQIRLSSPLLKKMPFVYLAFDQGFDLSSTEKNNVRDYLLNGGFMVIEDLSPLIAVNAAGSSFQKEFYAILGSKARFAPLSNSHELYHCFFDFTDGPPRGFEGSPVTGGASANLAQRSLMTPSVTFLEGVTVNGRLVAIFSKKRYVEKWNEWGNNDPQLRMGVNMIVYALTQPGGMAQ